jgi:hypothetical protein
VITAETIERILHFDSGGLPVVSIYVTVPTDLGDRRSLRSKASNLLHRIRPLGEDREIEHEARLSVREDI